MEDGLEARVLAQLIAAEQTVATAESATGGDIAARLARIAGSSRALTGGVVVYTAQTKQRLLGLDPALIEEHGVVGTGIAKALASAVVEAAGSDWGIAVTGVAGPGTVDELPVGYTAWALAHIDGTIEVDDRVFDGDRVAVITQLGTAALTQLSRRLGDG